MSKKFSYNYRELKKAVDSIASLNQKNKIVIQKIYSSAHYIELCARVPGKSVYIHVGRGGPFNSLLLSESRIHQDLREIDHFLEFLRKHIKGAIILGVEIDENDKLTVFNLISKGKQSRAFFFYKGRELYFGLENEKKTFLSWKGWIAGKENQVSNYLRDLGYGLSQQQHEGTEKEVTIKDYNKDFLVIDNKESRKSIKKKNRTILKIENDLEKANKWKEIEQKVAARDLNLKGNKIEVCGISFNFHGETNEYKKIDRIYHRIKRLKKATTYLEKKVEELKKDTYTQEQLRVKRYKMLSPVWKKERTKKLVVNPGAKVEGVIYFEYLGRKGAIGLSATLNDYLRKAWANKETFWIHIDNEKSAHLFYKAEDSSLRIEDLQVLGTVLAEKSKTNLDQIDIVYTQVKYLKGVKGRPGSVTYKKEKYLKISEKIDWRKFITLAD